LPFLSEVVTAQNVYARKGFLNLRQWDFEQSPIPLNGEWEFYMSELIAPQDFRDHAKSPQDYIDFPATWNKRSKGRNPGDGYATYHLKVVVDPRASLALELPHFYSNYSVWINSMLIASNGTVGSTEKTSKPQWLPQTVSFNAGTDTLDIVIQASNFHHAKGGVREPLLLGDSQKLEFKKQVAVVSNLTEFIGLAITALIFIFLYLFSKPERSLLYFAGLCLTWGLRSLFSNRYVAVSFFPDFPWELCVKIEYITLYLMMILAILFLAHIFRNDVNTASKYIFCLFNGIFIVLTLFFRASLYTQFLPVYLSFAAVLLIYMIYILIRALVYERDGVWLMISCLFLGVIMFSYDIVSYQGFATYNPVIISIGYFVMYMLMGICLLFQLGYLKRPSSHVNVLTYEDLYGDTKKEKR
jgi:hypothetical protein